MEWNLHYPRWMIDDGSPDRRQDETFNWTAVEFWNEAPFASTSEREKSAEPVGDYEYRVVANAPPELLLASIFPSRTMTVRCGLAGAPLASMTVTS